jgi:hypothetical protein
VQNGFFASMGRGNLIYAFHFGIGWRLKNDAATTFDRVEETGKPGEGDLRAIAEIEG